MKKITVLILACLMILSFSSVITASDKVLKASDATEKSPKGVNYAGDVIRGWDEDGYIGFSDIDLTGVKWGVNDKKSFSRAISATLSPFNNLLFMLLCSGKYNLAGITSIKGGDGYETAIVPFLNALGCEVTLSQAEFKAQAKEWYEDMLEDLKSVK